MDKIKSALSHGKSWAGLAVMAQMAKAMWPGHAAEFDAFTWVAAALAVGMD